MKKTKRSPLIVPLGQERFAFSFNSKYKLGLFLGTSSPERESIQRGQFNRTRSVGKFFFRHANSVLEPTAKAINKTNEAAYDFFSLSYQLLSDKNQQFPLAGYNKCLGMVVVPGTRLVILAISQDKDPNKDKLLRQKMVNFLDQLNQSTNKWMFELACIPTQAEYLILRTLSTKTPQEAPDEWVKPHTRCVEVALMVALCKAGRFKKFTAQDTGIMAYGGTLWASQDGTKAIPHFEGTQRNTKYRGDQNPLEVKLADNLSGWIDIWEPCPEHCKIYKHAMLALGAAGGPATSFIEPRAEWQATMR